MSIEEAMAAALEQVLDRKLRPIEEQLRRLSATEELLDVEGAAALIEAGRALQEAARREDEAKRRVLAGPQDKASLAAMYKATEDVGGALGHLCGAALALSFEKPRGMDERAGQQRKVL